MVQLKILLVFYLIKFGISFEDCSSAQQKTRRCSYEIEKSKILTLNCFNVLHSFKLYMLNQTEINEKCISDIGGACNFMTLNRNSYRFHGNLTSFIETDGCFLKNQFSQITNKTTVFIADVKDHQINLSSSTNFLNLSLNFNFRGNGLKNLQVNAFENLKFLETIDLSLNEFKELPFRLFQTNVNLKHFILEANIGALELPYGFLANKKNLQTVKLNGNKLKKLPMGLFSLSENIEEIDLSNNELESLPE